MDSTLDVKLLLKHLVNGDLEENLCRICLQPFTGHCENIFTRICKEDQEYCIADILEDMFGFKFAETDNYFVCTECFIKSSNAYNFYLKTKRNNEILSFYVNELEGNVNAIGIPDTVLNDTLCISLPEFTPETPDFNYSLGGIISQPIKEDIEKVLVTNIKEEKEIHEDDDRIVIIKDENGTQSYFKILPDGYLTHLVSEKKQHKKVDRKMRKKREPMLYKQCSRCPIKYRFISKLKDHMITVHGVHLHACKICQALFEDEEEFRQHLKTHTNSHQCELCDTVFRKRATMIAHIKWHEKNQGGNGNHVCKDCGAIAKSEEELKDHCNLHHNKNHTCYYCGRMYKGTASFEQHIAKHEKYIQLKEIKRKNSEKQVTDIKKPVEEPRTDSKKFTCETCGRNFLGERALMWHNRLHTNERPYACEVCGKGFVSENRRNQHALCAHTVPTRRCPLCPALFHLRSMVNTHIKKVHLKVHKRRNRTMRHQQVFWDTQPVPIQELSVSIQNDILELQAAREIEALELVTNI